MSPYNLEIEDAPAEQDIAFLKQSLIEYNVSHSTIGDSRDLAVFLRNDQGKIIGGVSGSTWGACLEIEALWLQADLRGKGFGKKLLQAIEERAVARGCTEAVLDTYSFQAPAFYQRLGYEIFGVIEGFPDKHKKFFLKKKLPS